MSESNRPAGASALVALFGLLALGGVGVAAAGSLMFSGLGRSAAGADAEGPGVAAKALKAAEAYALERNRLSAQRTNTPDSMRVYAVGMKAAKSDIDDTFGALRRGGTEPIAAVFLLQKRKAGGLSAVALDGEITSWGPLQVSAPGANGVRRTEADSGDTGMVMFSAPVTNGPAGRGWTVYVVYDGIRILQPGWGPLRSAAAWNATGLVLLLIGGFGLYFSLRHRRRVVAEAEVAANVAG